MEPLVRWATGRSEDVRCRRQRERERPKHERFAVLFDEAGALDRTQGLTAGVAAASDVWPEQVECLLCACEQRPFGADVLVETQLAAGTDDATKFGECACLVDDRAEDE